MRKNNHQAATAAIDREQELARLVDAEIRKTMAALREEMAAEILTGKKSTWLRMTLTAIMLHQPDRLKLLGAPRSHIRMLVRLLDDQEWMEYVKRMECKETRRTLIENVWDVIETLFTTNHPGNRLIGELIEETDNPLIRTYLSTKV